MRSLTRSSAGFPAVIPPSPTKTLTPTRLSHVLQPSSPSPTKISLATSYTAHSVLAQDHHPFFNISTGSHLLSSRARDHVSLAIQNGWARSTVKRYAGTIKQYILFLNIYTSRPTNSSYAPLLLLALAGMQGPLRVTVSQP